MIATLRLRKLLHSLPGTQNEMRDWGKQRGFDLKGHIQQFPGYVLIFVISLVMLCFGGFNAKIFLSRGIQVSADVWAMIIFLILAGGLMFLHMLYILFVLEKQSRAFYLDKSS